MIRLSSGGSRPLIIKAAVWAFDVAAAGAAMLIALALPPYNIGPGEELAQDAAWLLAAICAAVFPLQALHRGVWRFLALNDVLRIANAVALANLVFLVVLFAADYLDTLPRPALLSEAILLTALLVGARFARQLAASGDWRSIVRLENRNLPAALLAGSSAALDAYLREALRRPGGPPFRVRGLIEPGGGDRHGRSIRGSPILGGPEVAESALISLSATGGPEPQLIVVDPGLKPAVLLELAQAAARGGGALVRVRLNHSSPYLSPLDAADLLGRPPRPLNLERVRRFIEGRRVLVTGAGGTIGSELTRQIAPLSPAGLTLVDAGEYNLYQIELELSEGGYPCEAYLGDVRDMARINDVFAHAKPHIVLHAAALKHVPLMEVNPAEAALTNVLGTAIVAEAARAHGAAAFVLISTDKAVEPTNIMGATKRVAELYIQALDAETEGLRAVAVRFGNVLGSTGSVAPLFERQIARGGPITVTHPEITRYFMTTEEAAALVLQAAALGEDEPPRSAIYVLDMGEPVLIDRLARELCRLRGLAPGVDIEIVYTGLRPGEKLHEAMFYSAEEVRPTSAPGVLAAEAPMLPLAVMREALDAIVAAARSGHRAEVRRALAQLAPELEA